MMLTRLLPTLAAIAVLSACAAQRKPLPAPPPPAPAPAPAPVATATPAPPPADWRDAAQTPGIWTYALMDVPLPIPQGTKWLQTIAAFGPDPSQPKMKLACLRSAGQLKLARRGSSEGPVPVTITTTSASRSFTAALDPAMPGWLTFTLPPRDPITDAMAFSRGRFMVEVPGLPALYLPAWPEVARVIEDCR